MTDLRRPGASAAEHGGDAMPTEPLDDDTWFVDSPAIGTPTVFDRLDESLCRALVYRGWWLTGAALATYHPARLGEPHSFTAPPT